MEKENRYIRGEEFVIDKCKELLGEYSNKNVADRVLERLKEISLIQENFKPQISGTLIPPRLNQAINLLISSKFSDDVHFAEHFIPHVKTFSLTTHIYNSLIDTKNQIYAREMPFNVMFINFPEEGINSILGEPVMEEGKCIGARTLKSLFIVKAQDNTIAIRTICHKGFYKILNKEELYTSDGLLIKNSPIPEYSEFQYRVCIFVCNFLDFLNHPDVDTKVISWHNNDVRIKKGKLPIPDRVDISVTGKLYKYLYEDMPKMSHSSPSHSFWVRGHYFHFRNRDNWNRLYLSDSNALKQRGYQVDSSGLISKWILPCVKGKGILVSKNYKVSDSTNSDKEVY